MVIKALEVTLMDKTCLIIMVLGVFLVLIMVGAAFVDHIGSASKVELRAPFLSIWSER
jgi:hypothetical protein